MSNYRRLISYIYAYEGGVKGKNIGFAKLETRNGLCRIQVSVKRVFLGSSDIGVYLLSPGEDIFLGNIFIRNGAGEFRTTVNAADVEESGRPMDQFYGLTIHEQDNAWRCYTTIWEDAITQAAQVEPLQAAEAESTKPETAKTENIDSENSEPIHTEPEYAEPDIMEQIQSLPLPISEEIEQQLKQEEQAQADSAPWEEENDNLPVGEATGETAGETAVGMTKRLTKNTTESQLEETAESLTKETVKSLTEESIKEPTGKTAKKPTQGTTENLTQGTDENPAQRPAENSSSAPGPGDPIRLRELDRLEQEEAKPRDLWSALQRRYAKVKPFDYEKGCEILSIKPQDIGILPRENWVYGNNSFLLHGYYNYRHLILARLENPQGMPRYLLGVPGHYFSNEKRMAAMFGFPGFVLAKQQPEEDGRFGYWYTDVRI